MGDRNLILPFVLVTDDLLGPRSFLSRQVPVMLRNALDSCMPGVFIAAPLATEVESTRRWVIHRNPWAAQEAIEFASAQNYAVVVTGALSSIGDNGLLHLNIEAIRCSDGRVLASGNAQGQLLEILPAALATLSSLCNLTPEKASALFRPRTNSPAAFEFYSEGLDVLLTLRSADMELRDPDTALQPFDQALQADPDFEAAVTAGLSTALQCLESDRIAAQPSLAYLESWQKERPLDRRIVAVMVEILIGEERLNDALDLLRVANEPTPDRDLTRRRADLLVELGRFPEALRFYQTVEEMQHDPVVLERISALAQMAGQFDLALSTVRMLTQDVDNHPTIWCRLAWLKSKVGSEAGIWTSFRRGLDCEQPPAAEDFLKLNSVLGDRTPPAWFVDHLKHWLPPPGLQLDARVLLGRALRLCGQRLAAKLCLAPIESEDLNVEFQTVLAREQAALSAQ